MYQLNLLINQDRGNPACFYFAIPPQNIYCHIIGVSLAYGSAVSKAESSELLLNEKTYSG